MLDLQEEGVLVGLDRKAEDEEQKEAAHGGIFPQA